MVNIPTIHLWIYDKYSSTSFKKRLPAEYHGNNTLNIIIFPLNVLLGFVAQWSRSRPSVKMVHVLLLAKLFYLCCVIFFSLSFCFCFQSYFCPWLVFRYSYCWSIRASRGFCSKRISSDVYIILTNSFTVRALPIEIWSTWTVQRTLKESRKTIACLLKFHKRAAQICVFPRSFLTLRVTQLVLKIVHLAISMEPRGPRACGLPLSLWLLVAPYSLSCWQGTSRLFFFMYSFLIRQCYCDGTSSLFNANLLCLRKSHPQSSLALR